MPSPQSRLRPLRHWVVVELEPRKGTFQGLILPDHTKPENVTEMTARVVAVGDGEILKSGVRKPMTVKVGDRVAFRGFLKDASPVAQYFKENPDLEYSMISEDDILCILPEDVEMGFYSEGR